MRHPTRRDASSRRSPATRLVSAPRRGDQPEVVGLRKKVSRFRQLAVPNSAPSLTMIGGLTSYTMLAVGRSSMKAPSAVESAKALEDTKRAPDSWRRIEIIRPSASTMSKCSRVRRQTSRGFPSGGFHVGASWVDGNAVVRNVRQRGQRGVQFDLGLTGRFLGGRLILLGARHLGVDFAGVLAARLGGPISWPPVAPAWIPGRESKRLAAMGRGRSGPPRRAIRGCRVPCRRPRDCRGST